MLFLVLDYRYSLHSTFSLGFPIPQNSSSKYWYRIMNKKNHQLRLADKYLAYQYVSQKITHWVWQIVSSALCIYQAILLSAP